MTRQLCSAGLAFIGFSMSLIIGLFAQNSYTTVVSRALYVMMVFYMLGLFISVVGDRVIQENFNQEIEILESQLESKVSEVADSSGAEPRSSNSAVAAEPVPVS